MLHRLILSQCSGFFEAGTSEDWSKAQARSRISDLSLGSGRALGSIGEDDETGRSVGSPTGDSPRWRYELDWGNKDDELPMLVQKVSIRLGVHVSQSKLTAATSLHLQHYSAVIIRLDRHLSRINHLHPRASFAQWPICRLYNQQLVYPT